MLLFWLLIVIVKIKSSKQNANNTNIAQSIENTSQLRKRAHLPQSSSEYELTYTDYLVPVIKTNQPPAKKKIIFNPKIEEKHYLKPNSPKVSLSLLYDNVLNPYQSNLIAQPIIIPTLKPIRKNILLPTFQQYITGVQLTPQDNVLANDIEQTSSAAKKSTRYLSTLDSKNQPVNSHLLEKQVKEAYEQIQRVLEENPSLTLPPPLSLKPTQKTDTTNMPWESFFFKHKPSRTLQVLYPTSLAISKEMFKYRYLPTDSSFHLKNNFYPKKNLWRFRNYANNLITTSSPIDSSQMDQSVSWKDYFQFENILKQMGYGKKNNQELDNYKSNSLNNQELNNEDLSNNIFQSQDLSNQNINMQESKNEKKIIQELNDQNPDIIDKQKTQSEFNNLEMIQLNNGDKRTKIKASANHLPVKVQTSAPGSVSYGVSKHNGASFSLYPKSSLNSGTQENKMDFLIHDDLNDEILQTNKDIYSDKLAAIMPSSNVKYILVRSHIIDENNTAQRNNFSNRENKIIPVRDDNIENKFKTLENVKLSNELKNVKTQIINNAVVRSLSDRKQAQKNYFYNENTSSIFNSTSIYKSPFFVPVNNRQTLVSAYSRNNETFYNLPKSYDDKKNIKINQFKDNITKNISNFVFNDFKNVVNIRKKEEQDNSLLLNNEKKNVSHSKEKQSNLKNKYSQNNFGKFSTLIHSNIQSLYSNITPPYFNIKPIRIGLDKKNKNNFEIRKKEYYEKIMLEKDDDDDNFNPQDHYQLSNGLEIQTNEIGEENNQQYSDNFINTNSVKDLLDIKYAQIENKLINDLKLRQAVLQKLEQDSMILEQEEQKKEKLLRESLGTPVSLSTLNEIFKEINEETYKTSNESKISFEPMKKKLNKQAKDLKFPTNKINTIKKLDTLRLEKKSHFTVNPFQSKNINNHLNRTGSIFKAPIQPHTLEIKNERDGVLRNLLTNISLPDNSNSKTSAKILKQKELDLLSKDHNFIKKYDTFTNQSNNDIRFFKKDLLHESVRNRHNILHNFFSLDHHSNVSNNNRLKEKKTRLKYFINVLNVFYKPKTKSKSNRSSSLQGNYKNGVKKNTEIQSPPKLMIKHPQLALDFRKNRLRLSNKRNNKSKNKKSSFNLLRLKFGVHNGNFS